MVVLLVVLFIAADFMVIASLAYITSIDVGVFFRAIRKKQFNHMTRSERNFLHFMASCILCDVFMFLFYIAAKHRFLEAIKLWTN